MDNAKRQLVDKLSNAKNVMVTVSRNPNIDQLAALLGLSLLLSKQGKHCAAVFSGEVPSTLDFLKPEETIERNTDSLRDFIIALDKSKADKLRYKVEDNIVRIFITPYRTSITQDDLQFSQGDFNVDVVIALGVMEQTDLDEVITAHGRILHDATVASINVDKQGNLGSINWFDNTASSLSELVTELSQSMGEKLLDEQIATALLTGIVAATDRFSNDKTNPNTMSMSAILMAAGANQQLVATKLEDGNELPAFNGNDNPDEDAEAKASDDGTLTISHSKEGGKGSKGKGKKDDAPIDMPEELPPPTPPESIELPEPEPQNMGEIMDVKGEPQGGEGLVEPVPGVNDGSEEKPSGQPADKPEAPKPVVKSTPGNKLITEPPSLGGTLTSNAFDNHLEPSTDPFSLPNEEPPQIFEHKAESVPPAATAPGNVVTPNPDAVAENQQASEHLEPEELSLDQLKPPPFDWSPPPPPGSETPAPSEPAASEAPAATPLPPLPPSAAPDSSAPPAAATIPPAAPEPPQVDTNNSTLSQIEKEFNSPHQYQSDINDTLAHLEEAVHSPHLQQDGNPPDTDSARDEVSKALNAAPDSAPPSPLTSLNAMPLGSDLHSDSTQTDQANGDSANSPQGPPPVAPPLPFDFGNPQP